MGWWRADPPKTQDPQTTSVSPHKGSPSGEEDAALETLAVFVQTLGECTFDADEGASEVREHAEAWARHVRVASDPPGLELSTKSSGKRVWSGLRRFVQTQLRDRHAAFEKVTGDLRDVVGAFVHSIGSVVLDTERSDRDIAHQLQRLRQSAETGSLSQLREEVIAVTQNVTRITAERQERQRDKLATLTARIHELRNELESARKQSELDPLTNLANRRSFDAYVASTVDFARLTGASSVLLFIDIDHFKSINDNYGHATGDAVLRRVADELVRVFPRRGDFIARYGGEEFCVVLRNTDMSAASKLAQRLLDHLRRVKIRDEAHTLSVTVSIGASALLFDDEAEDWTKRADAAMYAAKNAGRDRIQLAHPESDGSKSTSRNADAPEVTQQPLQASPRSMGARTSESPRISSTKFEFVPRKDARSE